MPLRSLSRTRHLRTAASLAWCTSFRDHVMTQAKRKWERGGEEEVKENESENGIGVDDQRFAEGG
jgi:hypothetical protein